MFERETEVIIKTVVEKLSQNKGNNISLKDILAADIPSVLKSFLHRDTENKLQEELQNFYRNSIFDFTNPEVKYLQDQMNLLLIHNFKFDLNKLSSRIDDTVHLLINYLIRPQWTLTNILFVHADNVSVEKIKLVLRLFEPYQYMREILENYLFNKNITSLTRDEFKTIIWKIDGEYLRRRTGKEVANLLLPVYTFFDYPKNTGDNDLPIKAFIKFFDDKGLITVNPRLEGEIAQGKDTIRHGELIAILEDIYNTLGSFTVENPGPEENSEQKKIDNDNSKNENSNTSDLSKEQAKNDFLISDSEKKRIIKKIFKDDEKSYNTTISALKRCTTWKQASKIIDEVLITYNTDPYSNDAQKFTSIVMKQYYQNI